VTLTDLLRTPLADEAGLVVGRPSEVIADASGARPVITGVDVRGRRRSLAGEGVVGDGSPQGDLLLVRDLLDVQVLDRRDRHRGRVGDVELATHRGVIEVVAVETGLRPVLRRLGLGRLAGRASFDRVEWAHLHPGVGRAHAYTAELADRPSRFWGVVRARRPPR
jgi:hypothetical protein